MNEDRGNGSEQDKWLMVSLFTSCWEAGKVPLLTQSDSMIVDHVPSVVYMVVWVTQCEMVQLCVPALTTDVCDQFYFFA